MTAFRLALTATLFLLTALPAAGDPLVIATSSDPNVLVSAIAGAGVTIVSGSATLTGTTTQQGTFTGGGGILPFGSGIILTSGSAALAAGPNNDEGAASELGTAGYAPLTTLAAQDTFDANVLSFQFVPTTDVLSFQFVFGSEEYHEFVGAFNDVFAFYLNGTNLALVPGTTTPISVNSVNCGSNVAYYHPNSTSSPCFSQGVAVNTQYDGLAGGLFAQPLFATGSVNIGVPNSIILAIADAGDTTLDSAVFIAGSSFAAAPPPPVNQNPVPEPATLTLLGVGLAGLAARCRSRKFR